MRTHPLVLGESFWQHEHCAKQVGTALRMYAQDHNGNYAAHVYVRRSAECNSAIQQIENLRYSLAVPTR